jgi:hypothetical protein
LTRQNKNQELKEVMKKFPTGGVEQIQFGMLHGSVDVVRNGRKD